MASFEKLFIMFSTSVNICIDIIGECWYSYQSVLIQELIIVLAKKS